MVVESFLIDVEGDAAGNGAVGWSGLYSILVKDFIDVFNAKVNIFECFAEQRFEKRYKLFELQNCW